MKRRHAALNALIWAMRLCGFLVIVVGIFSTAKYAGWIGSRFASQMNLFDVASNFVFSVSPGLILLALSSVLKLQAANYETNRATAIMVRRLFEQQYRPGQTPAQRTINGMWDEKSPKGVLWRPKFRRGKEFGGADRWDPQDMTEIRLRRGLGGHRSTE